ncbi:NAD(P)/FAD-dependent oxidoreductase [Acidiferrimicrobium sp. IK]|nr:NAD(P)/FAD-dependent oxidoreductase [Acidiferrimicrobium sp. IK]MCU4187401.1 NAD(P)/FAD-dependent oxidoreductase [Acidiferrimicrobium sp. IK]
MSRGGIAVDAPARAPLGHAPTAEAGPPDGSIATLIVGAGFAGIGAAIRLRNAHIDDFVILEGESGIIGGSWRDNSYPGATRAIPPLLHPFSFAPRPGWSRAHTGSEEIREYLGWLVDRYDLAPHIRSGRTVTGLRFGAETGRWSATTGGGEVIEARSVIMANGPLSKPHLPALRGISTYTGHTMHSARWDPDYDLAGKRVAVIGTGVSAVDTVPRLVRVADRVKVFQRTPGWVLPRVDLRTPAWTKALFGKVPGAGALARGALHWGQEAAALAAVWETPMTSAVETIARAHLHVQVRDPWLRRQLTPQHGAGRKRPLMSSSWYRALQADNCELITWPIATLSPNGIRTSDGIEHQVDCIVFATGFESAHRSPTPFPVLGVGATSLDDAWAGESQAFEGVSVAGFPNLFLTYGPGSGPGHSPVTACLEAQIDCAVQGVTAILKDDLRALDVKQESRTATTPVGSDASPGPPRTHALGTAARQGTASARRRAQASPPASGTSCGA